MFWSHVIFCVTRNHAISFSCLCLYFTNCYINLDKMHNATTWSGQAFSDFCLPKHKQHTAPLNWDSKEFEIRKLKYFWKMKYGPSSFYLWKVDDNFCLLPTPCVKPYCIAYVHAWAYPLFVCMCLGDLTWTNRKVSWAERAIEKLQLDS